MWQILGTGTFLHPHPWEAPGKPILNRVKFFLRSGNISILKFLFLVVFVQIQRSTRKNSPFKILWIRRSLNNLPYIWINLSDLIFLAGLLQYVLCKIFVYVNLFDFSFAKEDNSETFFVWSLFLKVKNCSCTRCYWRHFFGQQLVLYLVFSCFSSFAVFVTVLWITHKNQQIWHRSSCPEVFCKHCAF